jgi:uncharacterized membrane protein
MNEKLLLIGILFLVIGSLVISVASFLGNKNFKFAFGGFIGFIPIGFANDPQMFLILVMSMGIISMFFTVYVLKMM